MIIYDKPKLFAKVKLKNKDINNIVSKKPLLVKVGSFSSNPFSKKAFNILLKKYPKIKKYTINYIDDTSYYKYVIYIPKSIIKNTTMCANIIRVAFFDANRLIKYV